jgi:hypothetical protein
MCDGTVAPVSSFGNRFTRSKLALRKAKVFKEVGAKLAQSIQAEDGRAKYSTSMLRADYFKCG